MNRNLIFTFILLATLSTVYAIPHQPRQLIPTSSGLCSGNAGQLSVTVSPSPIVPGSPFTFSVSGTLNGDISSGSIFNAAFLDSSLPPSLLGTFGADFCTSQGISCPIPAGVEFSTTIQQTAPEDLPGSFQIGVAIISPRNDFVACTFIAGSA